MLLKEDVTNIPSIFDDLEEIKDIFEALFPVHKIPDSFTKLSSSNYPISLDHYPPIQVSSILYDCSKGNESHSPAMRLCTAKEKR